MVQGKLKTKAKLPSNCKQKSIHRVQKGVNNKASTKVTKSKSNTIEKSLKKNLETSIKKSIEEQLCQQAKVVEGKSFHIVKPSTSSNAN